MTTKHLQTYRKKDKTFFHLTLREYRDRYFVDGVWTIIRDLTVQRKGVWTLAMQQDFFHDAAVGDADNNPLHYVDLETSIAAAAKTGDFQFANHLRTFTDQGATESHVDGGNRSDSVIFTLTDVIPVKAGHYDFGVDDEGTPIYYTLKEDTLFSQLDDDLRNAILDYGMLLVCIYEGLSKEERKKLFKKLNDGIPLNEPEKRNCEESDYCNIIRNIDLDNGELFKNAGVLTDTKIERWNLSEFIAKLFYARRNLVVPMSGDVTVEWASSKDVDSDYVAGSAADKSIDFEVKFLKKELFKTLNAVIEEDWKFIDKNLWIDYWLIKSYMHKESIKLKHPTSKEVEKEFIGLMMEKSVEFFAETKKDYVWRIVKGKPVDGTFNQLYTKSNTVTLSQRLNRWINDFINPLIEDGEILFKIEKRTSTNAKERATLFKTQGGKTKISNTDIDSKKLHTYEVDHNDDLRHGGSDDIENRSIEVARENSVKGAKTLLQHQES